MSLHDIRYINGKMAYYSKRQSTPEWVLEEYIQEAKELFENLSAEEVSAQSNQLPTSFERLRWFHLPSEFQNPAQKLQNNIWHHNSFQLFL